MLAGHWLDLSPFAFGHTLPNNLPLYYEHETQIGTVDNLRYDALGNLLATVTTDHPKASRRQRVFDQRQTSG